MALAKKRKSVKRRSSSIYFLLLTALAKARLHFSSNSVLIRKNGNSLIELGGNTRWTTRSPGRNERFSGRAT